MTRSQREQRDMGLGRRERDLLRQVAKQGGRGRLARIARAMAEAERTDEPIAVRTQQLYTSLYNDHLHRLVEAGLVTYSEENGEIELTARGRTLWTDGG